MQIRLILGTVTLMITMLVFAYSALQERNRLKGGAEIAAAREIEMGAELYDIHCASCHGDEGRAETCFDVDGSNVQCVGSSLNSRQFFCEAEGLSIREQSRNWEGDPLSFVTSSIAEGYTQDGMPAFGQMYGGPLTKYEIYLATTFVLNWRTEVLLSCRPLLPASWAVEMSDLPNGNVEDGEESYQITYGCAACHGLPDEPDSAAVGPWVGDWDKAYLSSQIEGYTAADYLLESILLPSAHIAAACPTGPCTGPPSAMPANFVQRMSFQDMANVLSYILQEETLDGSIQITFPADD